MSVRPYFTWSATAESKHRVIREDHDSSVALTPVVAAVLADAIVKQICRRTPAHYNAWRSAVDGGPSPAGPLSVGLRAFLAPAFGEPGGTSIPSDHLEGFVAEYLWYFLMLETTAFGPIERVEPPGFKATDPGGDGLVVFRNGAGALAFCLWEIKKSTGTAGANATINKAVRQLSSNAMQYLARFATQTSEIGEADIEDLYCRLVDIWAQAGPEAGAGVCVTTSLALVPAKAFQTLKTYFPQLTAPPRLHGQMTVMGDFSQFAVEVQNVIWTGL